eukprot:748900-Hanusia_phi.AAC.2
MVHAPRGGRLAEERKRKKRWKRTRTRACRREEEEEDLMSVGQVACAVISLHYLQQAMRYHDNNKVIPTYYATFTLACIIGAAVVYKEFEGLTARQLSIFFVGKSHKHRGEQSRGRGEEERRRDRTRRVAKDG